MVGTKSEASPRGEIHCMNGVPGLFFWTDCGYLAGWRLQAHYRDGSFRLLSPQGKVVLRGTESACKRELELIGKHELLSFPTGRLVFLIHGLARNAWCMSSLARYLKRKHPDDEVVLFQYASTTAPVAVHACRLIQFCSYASQAREVHFVAHSLGNIVLRAAYRLAERGQWQMPKIATHVMLGPPNQGSQIAFRLKGWTPISWFTGAPFMQLGCNWQKFQSELAPPPCPFGIIAGRLPLLDRFHPVLAGPNDVIVRVEETTLDGAADFLEVRVPHNWLMNSRQVHRATSQFQTTLRFRPPDPSQPPSVAADRRVG